MKGTLPTLVMVSATALAAGGVLAPTHDTASAAGTKATTQKFSGPSVDMRWGPVRATIYVKNKKITKVSIATAPENDRSQFIDDQAVPMLQQETLKAQSPNIDEIGGATMTSDAYIESLQSAVKSAKHHKALK